MINWLYNAFLWILGFKTENDPNVPNEKITYMLRRQQKRLGAWWWVGLAGGTGFVTWLILHILEIGGL